MTAIAGIGGTLLPEQYLSGQLLTDAGIAGLPAVPADTAARLQRWWRTVSTTCGPASPLRVIFDHIAMPLFAHLGFTAHDVVFDGSVVRVRLATPLKTPVALVLTPWAARPSSRWADMARDAHRMGATWGFVLTPPFLSVVPTRGHASRRSVDISLPRALESWALPFVLAVTHASRFDPIGSPAQGSGFDVLLRRADAFQDGVRVDLQQGVESSLSALAPAIARANAGLTRRARSSGASPPSAFDEALTLVYRILFLLFAESRHLVPDDEPVYRDGYAVSHFCRTAMDGPAAGLWDGLAATSRLSRMGCQTRDMQMAPFNGALFARTSAPVLEQRVRRRAPRSIASTDDDERDDAVRRTLVALGSRRGRAGLEAINYRDLGVEQLGAVYERVLDLNPDPARPEPPGSRSHVHRHSRVRRETGTFYTPQPLAELVVRRTLAPLVDGATADAILTLRVVDPAMGSGAFLVAACRFLAEAYETALIGEGRLSAEDVDDHERARMRRLVAERCLSGVDRNATAVQLARLSLWLTTLAQGRPLGFLDHRLRVGDSLIGAWPGDLNRVAMRTARRPVVHPLFEAAGRDEDMQAATDPILRMIEQPDDTVHAVHTKERLWRQFRSDACPLHRWRVASDLWCARWFESPGTRPPDAHETRALIAAVTRADRTLPSSRIDARVREASRVAATSSFFHWPLEFPDVFADAAAGDRVAPGFDAVVGNPPWEMLRREAGTGDVRGQALLRYVRQSGQYPSCADGHLNLYQAFVDRALALVRPGGRVGLVLPWSVATDDGAAALRQRLMKDSSVDFLAGLDNAQGLFPIHRGLRFAVLSATTGRRTTHIRATFGLRTASELDALPARGEGSFPGVILTPDMLELISGPSRRVPDLRREGDLHLLLSLVRRFPRLGSTEGWNVSFGRELNATDVRPHLHPADTPGIPVVEGKHLAPFVVDTAPARRLAPDTIERMSGAGRISQPRLAYRDVSGVGNRFTLIAAVVPAGVVTTHTLFCLKTPVPIVHHHFLCAMFNSFVLNAVVRMLMGGHVTTTLTSHLPVPVWRGDRLDRRIAALARRLAGGSAPAGLGPRLQALVAHRFELSRDELVHVVDGFPLVPADERRAVLQWFDRSARPEVSRP